MEKLFYLCFVVVMMVFFILNGIEGFAQEDAKFIPIDISKVANRNFTNWDEEGANNLAGFPTDKQVFLGIPFNIIDPDKNNGKSCIILKDSNKSNRLPNFPKGVAIDINQRCSGIAFLHTSTWGVNVGNEIAQYIIEYDTGNKEIIPIIPGCNTSEDWWVTKDTKESVIAWEGKNTEGRRTGVSLFCWSNPAIDSPIKTITFKSLERMDTAPVLIGVTLIGYGYGIPGEITARLKLVQAMTETIESKEEKIENVGNKVAVFREEGFPASGMPKATTPEFIAESLKNGGFFTEFINANDLADKEIFNISKYNVLIMSYGECVPMEALPNIKRFVETGGGLVCPAGIPLSKFVSKEGGKWQLAGGPFQTIFGNILPIRTTYKAEQEIEFAVRLNKEYLPQLPDFWPIKGGNVGFMPYIFGSSNRERLVSAKSLIPLAGSIDKRGEMCAVPVWFTMANEINTKGRFLYLGFEGEHHPWNPGAWKYAREAIIDMIKIVANKTHVYIEDIRTNATCYHPGETVKVNYSVYTTTPVNTAIDCIIKPRNQTTIEYRKTENLNLKEGSNSFSFSWKPEGFTSFAYDILIKVTPDKTYSVKDQEMFMVWKEDEVKEIQEKAPDLTVGDNKEILADGKETWWTGVNLYGNDYRGMGAFYAYSHPLPFDWDKHLSYLKLMGANQVRIGYFAMAGPKVFSDPQHINRVKTLDASNLLTAYHRFYNQVTPMHYLPMDAFNSQNSPGVITKEMDTKDCLTDPQWIKLETDYLKEFVGHCKDFKNIPYELLNEPVYRIGGMGTEDSKDYQWAKGKFALKLAENVTNWHKIMKEVVREAAGRKVVVKNEQAIADNLFSGKVCKYTDSNSIHPYSHTGIFEVSSGTNGLYPFGLNLNGPNCLMGEVGVQSDDSFTENLCSLILGEMGLGFSNFYLYQTTDKGSGYYGGMGRYDETEPERMKQWRRWNVMAKYLDRGNYIRPKDILLVNLEAVTADKNLLLSLSDDYMALLKEGIHTRILTEEELKAAGRNVKSVVLPRGMGFSAETLNYLQTLSKEEIGIYSFSEDGYTNTGWIKTKNRISELKNKEITITNPSILSYINPKKDKGYTVILIGCHGKTEVKFKDRLNYSLNIPETYSVVLDFNSEGELLLAKAFGPIMINGKELIKAPEALNYVIVSADGKPISKSGKLIVESDYPSQVEVVDNIPDNSIRRLKNINIVPNLKIEEGIKDKLLDSLKTRGIEAKIINSISPEELGKNNIIMLGLPEKGLIRDKLNEALLAKGILFNDFPFGRQIILGTSRLVEPYNGVIITLKNPYNKDKKLILLEGVEVPGLEISISRLCVLDLLGDYSVMPWGYIE